MRVNKNEDKTAIRFLTYWVLGVFLALLISILRNGAWAGWWIQVSFLFCSFLRVLPVSIGVRQLAKNDGRDLIRKLTDPFYD